MAVWLLMAAAAAETPPLQIGVYPFLRRGVGGVLRRWPCNSKDARTQLKAYAICREPW